MEKLHQNQLSKIRKRNSKHEENLMKGIRMEKRNKCGRSRIEENRIEGKGIEMITIEVAYLMSSVSRLYARVNRIE